MSMNKLEIVMLGDLVKITGGGTPSRKNKEYWSGSIPWASVKDFNSTIINSTLEYITKDGLNNSASNLIEENSIIIPTRMALGKAAINLMPVAINQDLKALKIINSKKVITEYLLRYLVSIEKLIIQNGSGATVKGVTLDFIRQLKIPLPPLPEQKRIVEILDKAQGLIDKRKEQLAEMDELVKSLFYDMFGDPVTNPMGWEEKLLGNVGDLKRGKSKHRPRNAPELLGGKYPLIQTGDIANAGYHLKEYTQTYSELGLAQSKMWKKGTLCITIAANIAKTAILGFDSCFPDSVVAFLPLESVNNTYIQIWFEFLQKVIEDKAPESAQKNINLEILRNLFLPVPPLNLQNTFANRVETIEAEKERMQKSLGELEDNFEALMQRAFKGKL